MDGRIWVASKGLFGVAERMARRVSGSEPGIESAHEMSVGFGVGGPRRGDDGSGSTIKQGKGQGERGSNSLVALSAAEEQEERTTRSNQ